MTRRLLVYTLVITAAVLAVAGMIHLGASQLPTQEVQHRRHCGLDAIDSASAQPS